MLVALLLFRLETSRLSTLREPTDGGWGCDGGTRVDYLLAGLGLVVPSLLSVVTLAIYLHIPTIAFHGELPVQRCVI
jgi:hypothetical protein